MIKPADRQTQPVPLDEQPAKPRRGRPATGQALSNAERQRLYRERQKAQRNDNSNGVDYDELRAIVLELGERCKRAEDRRDELHDQVQRLQAARDELIRELRETKKELAQRNENTAAGWHVESRAPGKRKWSIVGESDPENEPWTNRKDAEAFAERANREAAETPALKGWKYRVVPA